MPGVKSIWVDALTTEHGRPVAVSCICWKEEGLWILAALLGNLASLQCSKSSSCRVVICGMHGLPLPPVAWASSSLLTAAHRPCSCSGGGQVYVDCGHGDTMHIDRRLVLPCGRKEWRWAAWLGQAAGFGPGTQALSMLCKGPGGTQPCMHTDEAKGGAKAGQKMKAFILQPPGCISKPCLGARLAACMHRLPHRPQPLSCPSAAAAAGLSACPPA